MALSAIPASTQLQITHGTSPHVVIDGEAMDRDLLKAAIKAATGNGDGRVSAKELNKTYALNPVRDGYRPGDHGFHAYTDAEKAAVKFLRAAGVLTGAADAQLRREVAVNAGLAGWRRG